MVPSGWDERRVKDVVKSLDAGISVNSEDDKDLSAGFKILKTSCVSKGVFESTEVKSVKEVVEVKRLKEPVLSNSIIISRMNTPLLVGANAYIESAPKNTFLPDRLWQVKPKYSKVDMCWLGYWFGSRHTRYTLSSNATGTSGSMKNITKPDVMSMRLLLPPLPEQRKIAKILSTWDNAIATTEKLIETSKQQKKALMQQLLTGKKRLINSETGKAFDGEWERRSMSDLVLIDRKSLGKKTPDNFEFKYISLSDVDVGTISKELEVHKFSTAPSRARRVVQEGDILLSTVRPNLQGFAIITSLNEDNIASTGFSVLTPKKQVSGDYIYQYIYSAHITGQIDSLVVGSNYPAINSTDVSGLKIYYPAFKEQQKIASVLTAADKEIDTLESKLAHFKQEKKALMQQLLTGKRRVRLSS